MNYQSLGNDFHKLVIDFGETINLSVINGEDTQTYSVKACLENATQADTTISRIANLARITNSKHVARISADTTP